MVEHSARLLVVDDSKVNRLLLTRSLELQGHRVASAPDGRVALQMLRSEPFDLRLLDIEMPEMDGFQVLEQLAHDLRLRDLPVIVTTVLEGTANVVRCIELGAEDHLIKPVNPVLLKARLDASLEKKRSRDQQKELVRRFATSEVAQDLEQSGFALGGKRVQAAVMFSHIRGFTSLVEPPPPEETIDLLNTCCTLMFEAISGQGGVVNQMIGHGLVGLFGAPLALAEPCLGAVRAAMDMIEMIELFNVDRRSAGKRAIRLGAGIAYGDVGAGYTSTQTRATYTCIGDTANLAARLEAHTKTAQRTILVDDATPSALGERATFEPIGPVVFKGKSVAVDVLSPALVRKV